MTPYVSAPAFIAYPTYLDLDDLRSGSNLAADQTAELVNILLMASQWCDNYAEQQLGAHVVVQNTRARADRNGNLRLHLDDRPYLSMVQVGYGYTPTSLTTLTSPQVWAENNNLLVPMSSGGAWSGSLQFGVPAMGAELFVQAVYVAGWVSTQLTTATSAGSTSLTVADPTGIQPGGQYRIWEPGVEETVTISPAWASPPTAVPPNTPLPATVTLAQPTLFAHTSGHDLSGMPADMRLAVINYAVSQLMRPDTAAEDTYPDTHHSAGTRQTDSRQDGSGLVAEAERILDRYRRIR
ncbi:hypothetical protein [Kitasatospora sp. NPDC001175]|uniref:hypothetical protein n=1 Tax=Kitasatospora sp. NPDC001175 TaxID=3157103 RepID=UPI003CFBF09F